MSAVALPESPVEALHVTSHASGVRKTGIPAKRPVSEHPESVIDVIVSILHFLCSLSLSLSQGRRSGDERSSRALSLPSLYYFFVFSLLSLSPLLRLSCRLIIARIIASSNIVG